MDFNVSNDQYYENRRVFNKEKFYEDLQVPRYGYETIFHTLSAYDLWRPFFPTLISESKLLNFHRPRLRNYSSGPMADFKKFYPIKSLTKSIVDYQRKIRLHVVHDINIKNLSEEEIIARHFLLKRASQVTAKTGELLLFEYCEEYPPILSQVGMASNIKTYSQPNKGNDEKATRWQKSASIKRLKKDGEITSLIKNSNAQQDISSRFGYSQNINNRSIKALYYSTIKTGDSMSFIENNLYRAPIYQHTFPENDFLVVRTRNSYYVRTVETIFAVGQIWPLVAIPTPHEANVTRFRGDLAIIHTNYMLARCPTPPRSKSKSREKCLEIDRVVKLFPDVNMANFRRRLMQNGAIFKPVNNYDKDNLLLFKGNSQLGAVPLINIRSKLTPEQYCINMSMLVGRQILRKFNYKESAILEGKETEVLAAPWNTTKAVLGYSSGRWYLDLKPHLIDPTGLQCREGFSCIPKARSVARERAVNKETMMTGPPNKKEDDEENSARLRAYRDEAQIISELQSASLGLLETLSSDEDDDDVEETGIVDNSIMHASDLEDMVANDKTLEQVELEKEERARLELIKEMYEDKPRKEENTTLIEPEIASQYIGKVLRITRRFKSANFKSYTKEQIVTNPKVIELYLERKRLQKQHNEKAEIITIDDDDDCDVSVPGPSTSRCSERNLRNQAIPNYQHFL